MHNYNYSFEFIIFIFKTILLQHLGLGEPWLSLVGENIYVLLHFI